MCRARSWIVVGDSRQLPPFIDDGAADAALLANYGLQEEMLSKTVFDRLEEHLPTECITTLDTQHRMVPQIGKLVSDCFYGGALKSAPKPWIDAFSSQLPRPVVWLTTCHVLHRSEARTGTSYSNTCEARIIYELLTRLDLIATQKRLKGWDVVILTSYGEQRHVIDREVAKLQLQSLRVECNTVDAVQGREAKVAIYSLTRSNSEKRLGFLKEKRRLNVALSRGQQYLVIVGDHIFARDAVGENPFAPVVNHIAQNRSDCVIKEFKR
jgi:superfamily I DNA and/or RNA helicase